ncbi:flagellar basal-body rod modification protein FlgD [Cerasibacillus quisquiliarum]|uniref:Flagellar basal body rod modification protein n=1 Tax=Cerasibacillus quisquiliarum TaxID=227865 RepID=A0A511UZ90_9BACI|nr:flagellar hook assembly protein FlgD [Cerasibacillus quisquiliarum]MBB5145861.1 flagellar basal-body rod modification protein FlgD [Cerasibacillus quisquiliarum]GEN30432.1 hypothetical protein CQU01_06700 [Cerasibacillus quisquiliarum]
MNTINEPSLYLNSQQKERVPSPELGKDEFLKILMTQLQNQDPLNPMEDREFISQMATFTTLEQTINMANSIDKLVQSQLISPVIQYSHMIEKIVTYQQYDDQTGQLIGEKSSQVVAVSQKDGWAILELKNGDRVYADAVIEVRDSIKGSE